MRAAVISQNELGSSYAKIMSCYHEVIYFDELNDSSLTLAETIKARELILVAAQEPIDLLKELNELVISDQIIILLSKYEEIRKLSENISNCRFVYNPCLTSEKVILGFNKANWNNGETMADIITIRNFYAPMMKIKPVYTICKFEEANQN